MTKRISHLEMVFRQEFGDTAAALRVLPGVPVKQFTLQRGHVALVDTVTVRGAGATSETEEIRSMKDFYLLCEQGTNLVVIRTVILSYSVKNLAFHTRSTRTMRVMLL